MHERLELFIDTCHAVQHAHQKGIIHRDLKPSNILVTMRDDKPIAKVIDFGVAKALNDSLAEHSVYTAFGQMIGTPMYMSPEQAQLNEIDVDTRSDVYSLGVLLYELLTGVPPFDRESLNKAGFDEMRRIIREDEPPKPSARLSTLGVYDRSTVVVKSSVDSRKLSQSLKGELDWVVMKALEKDRNRRYESPNALVADIKRYLSHEPVAAGPPTVEYRMRKFVHRHQSTVIAVMAVVMALVVGTAVASWQAVRAITERDRAVIAEGLANEQLDLVEQQKETITQERDRVTVAELKARKTSYLSDMKLAYRDMSEGRHFNAKQLLNRQIAEGSESDLRGLEWWAAQNLINSQTQVVGQHEGHVRDLAFFSDRTQLASVGEDGFVRIWDLKQRQQLRAFHVSDSPGFSVAVSPDGKWIAYGSGQDEHDRTHVIVVDAQTGEFLAKLNSHPAYIRSIRFSPDGRFLASGSTAHSVCIWKFREGLAGESIEVPADPNPDIHFRLEFLSGGKQLMMEYHNRAGFRVWDVESLTPVIDIRENEIGHSSVWSFHEPTGLLASRMVSSRKEIDLYDTRTKKRFGRKLNPTEFPECLEISPDAKYLCMGGSSGALHFWKLLWGGISDNRSLQAEFVTSVQRHLGAISRIRFVDNETLVSIGRDGRVVLSSLPDKNPATKSLTESVSPVLAVLSPDQKTLLWSGSNRKIYLDDQITGKRIWESEVFPHIPAHLCWAGDSRHLAVITTLGEFSCWRQDEQVFSRYFTGKVDEFHLPEAMVGLALNREGRFLYISGGDGLIPEVRVWDTLEQQEVQHFPTQADPHRLLITPDDRYLIAGYEKLHVFDRMTGFELHQWTVGGVVSSFAHSIEGDVLLAGYEDGVIRFWNYHTGELLKTLSHHRRRVSALALTRDNCTLISGDDEGVVSFWNFETGEHIGNIVDFPGSLDRIQSLLLSSDESYLDLLIGHQLEDRHMERLWLKRESHPE